MAELLTIRIAWVRSTVGDHAAITPCSVANKKRLGPEAVPFVATKPSDPLKTIPVGCPPVDAVGEGICTTSDCTLPWPSYRVDTIPSAAATQTKPKGLKATPQPF